MNEINIRFSSIVNDTFPDAYDMGNSLLSDGTQHIGEAIDSAIREMPDDFLIKKFIIANQAEVKNMCLTEYDEEEVMEMFKEEGREEGRKEAWIETTLDHLGKIMNYCGISLDKAMDILDIPGNERNRYRILMAKQ